MLMFVPLADAAAVVGLPPRQLVIDQTGVQRGNADDGTPLVELASLLRRLATRTDVQAAAAPSAEVSSYLTVPEAAERLGISTSKLQEYVRSGELPSLAIGRSRRIAATDLDAFCALRREGSLRA